MIFSYLRVPHPGDAFWKTRFTEPWHTFETSFLNYDDRKTLVKGRELN